MAEDSEAELARFSLWLPAGLLAQVQALAARTGDPAAAWVRRWIREGLAREGSGE